MDILAGPPLAHPAKDQARSIKTLPPPDAWRMLPKRINKYT